MTEQQYNPEQAFEYIVQRIKEVNEYQGISFDMLKEIVKDIMDLENEYLKEAGILGEEAEMEEEAIYDEEDAFNFIYDELRKKKSYKKIEEETLESIIDDFLEYNYEYMESIGLIG